MRHLTGIGLAIILAGAVFFAGGWGYLRLLRLSSASAGSPALPAAGANLLHDTPVLYAVAALAGTALLAGIFIAGRGVSPLAAGLPGLALVGWTVWYGLSMRRAVQYIPLRGDAFGAGFAALLMNGLLAAAGLALIVPLFIPSRWRSWPRLSPVGARYRDQDREPTATISLLSDWTDTAPYPPNDPPYS